MTGDRDDYRSMLASVGASVDAFTGSRMFRCPVCSHHRKKKAEKCLSVRVDSDGFAFKCHHCDWSGGSGRTRHAIASRATSPPPVRRDDQQDKIEAALRIWRDSVDPRGTVTETYLATRELTLPDYLAGGVLRFHAALYLDGRTVPGMVALLRDIGTNAPCGIIRTFFDAQGNKIKRMMLGRASDAAVKLDAGSNVTEGLHICEGSETGIAAMVAGYRPVWALGSAGAIARFPVLGGVGSLTVFAEKNDGGANARAVAEASARWQDAGREVFTVEPVVGDDINDTWREAVR
ncbi:MAG: DUF7146 domain-containing protein [Rhizomicrobium sp.]